MKKQNPTIKHMESEVENTQCNIGSPSAHWERYFKVQTSQRPEIIIHCQKTHSTCKFSILTQR